ncbi:arsenate reductase (glutaredoxin) [Roseospira marina]|uniref:Arsenate reductase n=1 Tax=Roseospira marina TaxID=140057 RepID=A0A5M6IFC3_9PROT|nr:arsenate reductase (glutaredoxin) [Roseospira marina]KAA5606984.1 arsenate reductase (glutaredoxin) [Roseospira marina]MBB4312836.1 arsenate reductase [Roseospira marina]MBB5086391.1 arsenate reductase [Roseospira marina]
MTVVMYHNPRCSKSRATLSLLRDRGIEPEVVPYLDAPPDADTVRRLLQLLKMAPRDLMRKKEAREAGLADPDLNDEALIAGMIAHPIVIERPIVVANGRARLGRPPEAVLEIL